MLRFTPAACAFSEYNIRAFLSNPSGGGGGLFLNARILLFLLIILLSFRRFPANCFLYSSCKTTERDENGTLKRRSVRKKDSHTRQKFKGTNVFNCTIMSTFIRKREVKANALKIEQIEISFTRE